jgi:hypothetical protein
MTVLMYGCMGKKQSYIKKGKEAGIHQKRERRARLQSILRLEDRPTHKRRQEPKPFAISELEHLVSAEWQHVFRARKQFHTKHVEDQRQSLADVLPFGARLHSRRGAGARNNRGTEITTARK